jgi:hypothetical protein
MVDDDLMQLAKEQLEERFEAAIRKEREAQIAYNAGSGNLSGDRSGQMPRIQMSVLKALDEELQRAQTEREAIEREMRRRG